MSNSSDKSNPKIYTAIIFIASVVIFILSLFPGAFSVSSINLAGVAGGPNEPSTPSTSSASNTVKLSVFDNSLSIISGMISILSAIYGIQLGRSEFAKLKAAQIDREMQMQEIEKLRLELELEKRKEAKRKQKQKATTQRKQTTKNK